MSIRTTCNIDLGNGTTIEEVIGNLHLQITSLRAENERLKERLASKKDALSAVLLTVEYATKENEKLRAFRNTYPVAFCGRHGGFVSQDEEDTCPICTLAELLATEQMSANKTHEHNNRLINEVDRLRDACQLAYDLLYQRGFFIETGDVLNALDAALTKVEVKNEEG